MNGLGYSCLVLRSMIGFASIAAPTLCTVPARGEVASIARHEERYCQPTTKSGLTTSNSTSTRPEC